MADEVVTTTAKAPIPRQLESPPRTTGNIQQDIPLIVDWMFRCYQIIQQAVNYINGQIQDNGDITATDLPNPQTSTVAQAQTTANQAYTIATNAQKDADALEAIVARNVSGTVTVSDASTGATVNFGTTQPNTNYTVNIQAKSITGVPVSDAYIITGKTYATGNFSFTIKDAPAPGNSITFEWHLARIT